MRPKHYFVLLLLALMLAIPHQAMALAPMHDFNCDNCHIPGWTVTQLENGDVCMTCHGSATSTSITAVGTSGGTFVSGDASNYYGTNPAHADETSHSWLTSTTNPDAGAAEPIKANFPGMFTRSGSTNGKLKCSRCHDVHGLDSNAKLMPPSATTRGAAPMQSGDLCLACHKAFADVGVSSHGLASHPVGMNYAASAGNNPGAYVVDPVGGPGELTLNAAGEVVCLTCHGVHATDSDATTVDGFATVGVGDGLILKHNGPSKEDPALENGICQACHVYQGHAMSSANQMGCMVCHGGHEYDATAPNYYMLKKQVTLPIVPNTGLPGTVTLDYTVDPTTTTNYDNNTGVNGALCLSCHDIPGTHVASAACADCHNHDSATGSFGAGCGSCHGYAPSIDAPGNSTSGGYAFGTGTLNDYSADPSYKDESTTPHARHANGAGNYTFGCIDCHGTGAGNLNDLPGAGNHDGGTFQQVLDTRIGALTNLTSAGTTLVSTYNEGGAGSCSAVYCHSNGTVQGRAESIALVTAVASPWAAGAGTISTCNVCHDIGGANDSPTHDVHIAKYSCNVCHADTATNATTLTATAIGGTHVNGSVDALFSGIATNATTTTYDDTTGTCSTYCHSSGRSSAPAPVQNPDWDVATTGDCGDCHGTDSVSPASMSGAHETHFTQGVTACDTCHLYTGISAATHINTTIDLVANACNTCHGSTAGNGTANDPDRMPVWTDIASVDCATCHTGSAISDLGGATGAGSYMDVAKFYTTGHGDIGLTAAPDCLGCHDETAAGHFNGDSADDRLTGAAATNDAFCNGCHGAQNSHYADAAHLGGGSIDGNACNICHNPHGENMGTNADVMLTVGAGFLDRTDPTDYFNGSNTGVCQVCHVKADGAGGIAHYNQTDAPDGHNAASLCTGCHAHDAAVAFEAGAGTNCGDCHEYAAGTSKGALTSGAHTSHIIVQDGDILNPLEDFSDCAECHGAGVLAYTYGSGGNHMNGSLDFGVVYNDAGTVGDLTDDTCTSACHATSTGDGFWTDTELNCDACHGNAPADGGADGTAHADHLAASVACATCHTVPPAGNTAHIDDFVGTDTEGAQLADRANATADEATVIEPSFVDGTDTCNTAACHNPGNDGHSAVWTATTGSTSSCALCHGNAPASGAHTAHTTVSGDTLAEDRTDCAQCHTGADTFSFAHLDGLVTVVAGYNDNATPANLTDDTCATACHTSVAGDGFWTDTALNCDSCHGNAPADGGADGTAHADHLAAGVTCGTCHTVPGAGNTAHIDDFAGTDSEGAQLVDRGTADADEATVIEASFLDVPNTCNTAACHNPSGTTYSADWTATTGSTSSCTLCHSNTDPGTNSHTEHIAVKAEFNVNGQAACADCHTIPGSDAHRDGTVNVNGAKIALWATPNCTTSCHADGVAATGVTPVWGTPSADCTICHTAPPTTGDHTTHLIASRVTLGMTCQSCHSGTSADSVNAAGSTHMDAGSNDVAAGGSYDAVAVSITGYTIAAPSTCATASCHVTAGTREWAVPTTCDGCHGNPPATGAHDLHTTVTLQTTAEDRSDCAQCHTGADSYTYGVSGLHRDGAVDVAAGYTGGLNGTCASACHNSTVGDGSWTDTALNCDACHGNPPLDGGGDGSAHADHLAAGILCSNCHTVPGAGNTSHIDDFVGTDSEGAQLVDRGTATADEATVTEASFNDGTNTCNTGGCHNPSGTGYAADWDSSTSSCALCHVDTTGDPATGAHTIHRGATGYAGAIACSECHTVPVSTSHFSGVVEVPLDGTIATGGTATAAGTTWNGTTCSAVYCHDGGLFTSTGKSDAGLGATPSWTDTTYLDGSKANDCVQCHDMPPNPAKGHVANTDCNVCHFNTTATTNDGFTDNTLHDNGNVEVEGGDNCTDCHSSVDIDNALNGAHLAHTETGYITGKTVSGGNYGGAGWYTTTYVSGQPVFGCGQCHPAAEGVGHPVNGLNVDIDYKVATPLKEKNNAVTSLTLASRSSVTCASVYCHSDASGTFKTTPDWYNQTLPTDGTECAACHGNSPTTGAHSSHEVGIHYTELYDDDGIGLMASSTTDIGAADGAGGNYGAGAAHGDSTNSSTINCYTCHSQTVANSDNAVNTTCGNCHSDGGPLTFGEAKASISTNPAFNKHINGVKDVVFADLTVFKSKAQLRDNLADADDAGTLLSTIWNRITGYKGAAEHDLGLVAATPYAGGTCSTIVCHNGNTATWSDSNVDCMYCHTSLPK